MSTREPAADRRPRPSAGVRPSSRSAAAWSSRRPVLSSTVVDVAHSALTPTALPAADAFVTSTVPRVRITLDGDLTPGLRRRLAPHWTVSDDTDPRLDLAVVRGSDPDRVVRLCREHPGLAVLALIPPDATPDLAVRMLSAGADGCLRGADPDEVNAHLGAMSRHVARRSELVAV